MSEAYMMEDKGDGYPMFYDPVSRMNFYASRETGRRWTFPVDAPDKYAATCKISARANYCLPKGYKTSLSRDGARLVVYAPDGRSEAVPVDDPARFREVCQLLRGN